MSRGIERRREPRGQLAMPGTTRDGHASRCCVAVTDLSTYGCRIIFASDGMGHAVQLIIGLDNLAPQRAHMRWRDRLTAGLEFEQPLYLPVVDHLVAKWRLGHKGSLPAVLPQDGVDLPSPIETGLTLTRSVDQDRSDDIPGILNRRPGLGYRMIYR